MSTRSRPPSSDSGTWRRVSSRSPPEPFQRGNSFRFPVRLLRPPYPTRVKVLDRSALRQVRLPKGGVLVSMLFEPDHDHILTLAMQFSDHLAELWRMVHDACMVVCFETTPSGHLMDCLRTTSMPGVRCWAVGEEDLTNRLRAALTRPRPLGHEVVEWFGLRRTLHPPGLGYLAEALVDGGLEAKAVSLICSQLSVNDRSIRARFRRSRLPAPSAWRQLGQSLGAALTIQREGSSLLQVAWRHGYSVQSSLSRQFRHMFGLSPGRVRGTLGWEWLASRWVDRKLH